MKTSKNTISYHEMVYDRIFCSEDYDSPPDFEFTKDNIAYFRSFSSSDGKKNNSSKNNDIEEVEQEYSQNENTTTYFSSTIKSRNFAEDSISKKKELQKKELKREEKKKIGCFDFILNFFERIIEANEAMEEEMQNEEKKYSTTISNAHNSKRGVVRPTKKNNYFPPKAVVREKIQS